MDPTNPLLNCSGLSADNDHPLQPGQLLLMVIVAIGVPGDLGADGAVSREAPDPFQREPASGTARGARPMSFHFLAFAPFATVQERDFLHFHAMTGHHS